MLKLRFAYFPRYGRRAIPDGGGGVTTGTTAHRRRSVGVQKRQYHISLDMAPSGVTWSPVVRRAHMTAQPVLLHELLSRARVHVEQGKVARDDGNRERHEQHAPHGTHAPDDASEHGRRNDVTVADGRHGDDAPPEADRDVGERARLGGVTDALGVEHERREHDHRDEQEDGEHHQLVTAGPDRVQQDRQRPVVADHVEDAEDANDAQYEDRLEHGLIVLQTVVLVRQFEDDLQV